MEVGSLSFDSPSKFQSRHGFWFYKIWLLVHFVSPLSASVHFLSQVLYNRKNHNLSCKEHKSRVTAFVVVALGTI